MTRLTPGAALAWKIAAYEALHLNAEFLEKEHLFIGLLSLDKIVPQDNGQVPGAPVAEVMREWDALGALLEITGHDPVVLRRLMRTALRKGTQVRESTVIHRSPACRDVFFRAARYGGDRPVSATDLFSSIMEQPGETIAGVLAESRRCIAAGRQTDVLLPPGPGMTDSTRTAQQGFDLRTALSSDIRRYAESLVRWPEESNEYRLTIRAIRQKSAGLVYLCLDDIDRSLLHVALADLVPYAGDYSGAVAGMATDIGALPDDGRPVPVTLKDQVRGLLRRIEELDRPGLDP